MTMYAGDEFYDDEITSGPIGRHYNVDHDAERESMWCDGCGCYHAGECAHDD